MEKKVFEESLKEINYYFINLNVNLELASQCIVSLAQKTEINEKVIYELL